MPQKQMPKNWEPPAPAWKSTFTNGVKEVVQAYIAIQSQRKSKSSFYPWLRECLNAADGPDHVERGNFTDSQGYVNDVFIGYWTDPAHFDNWQGSDCFRQWWTSPERLHDSDGYWCEAIRVPLARLETLASSENKAGIAVTAQTIEGPIKDHGYWGAARDRLAASETSTLESPITSLARHSANLLSRGRRLRVTPPHNLCLLRSAQNWSRCQGEEREVYLHNVHPVLQQGMQYLQENPLDSGCCSCRFMAETTLEGEAEEKTFGMVYFLSLAHLEKWAKTHHTHLAIYGEFMKMLERFDFNTHLQLWHEGTILDASHSVFEYINCHPNTGLLPYFGSASY